MASTQPRYPLKYFSLLHYTHVIFPRIPSIQETLPYKMLCGVVVGRNQGAILPDGGSPKIICFRD
jgi:hypothetical protein